jgi:hypothetical protein
MDLLKDIPLPPREPVLTRATREAILQFTRRTGAKMPSALCDWLAVVNGARIGPGGVLGIRPDDPGCDIECLWKVYPEWRNFGWIPIAGDGCGNYYVVSAHIPAGPVFFIDAVTNHLTLAYVVASGIWEFFRFLFQSDLGETAWPFQRDFVVGIDPKIEATMGAPMPWNA